MVSSVTTSSPPAERSPSLADLSAAEPPNVIVGSGERPAPVGVWALWLVRAVLAAGRSRGDGRSQPAQQPPRLSRPPASNPRRSSPPADPQQPPPRIRTGINYVRVDVIVSDKKGDPVLDLKQDDFNVSEDGKPQKIEAFDVVKIDTPRQAGRGRRSAIRNDFDEEQEAARPDVRLFVILLDDYHVRRGNDMAVRKPLIDFIQNQLAPADMVARHVPAHARRRTCAFYARPRARWPAAISKFEGRKFVYTPRNSFEEHYAYYPAAVVERVRNQVTMDGAQGRGGPDGGAARGAQVDHLRERGVHHDPASGAAERSRRGDAGFRQCRTAATRPLHNRPTETGAGAVRHGLTTCAMSSTR